MGSLTTHFSAFLFLCPIGIRRLLSSCNLYRKSPPLYRAKTWHLSQPIWKNVDLFALLFFLPIAAFSEFFWSLSVSGQSAHQFAFAQHAGVLLLFWIILLSVILRETFDVSVVNDNLMLLVAGGAFLVEFWVMGRGYSGIAGRVYELLGALTILCGASCVALSFKPAAFFADVGLSFFLLFKGTWVLEGGLLLFSDAFLPQGCEKMTMLAANGKGDLKCDLEDDRLRGLALVDFLFVVHAIGIFFLNIVLLGISFCNRILRSGTVARASSGEMESDGSLIRALSEFVME